METDNTDVVDYIKLADAYGIEGRQVNDMLGLNDFLSHLNLTKPVLLECRISKDDNVLPIVPAGQSLEALILEAD